jgi:hypothetical protein
MTQAHYRISLLLAGAAKQVKFRTERLSTNAPIANSKEIYNAKELPNHTSVMLVLSQLSCPVPLSSYVHSRDPPNVTSSSTQP